MAVNSKGSRKIVVDGHEFRWQATGNDDSITLVVWPIENEDSRLIARAGYHHDWNNNGDGSFTSRSQAIITNRVVREVILEHGVDRLISNKGQIKADAIEDIFDMAKAVRSRQAHGRK